MRMYQFLREILPNALLQLVKKSYFYYARATFLTRDEAISQIKARAKHIKEVCQKIDLFISPSQFLRNKFIEFGLPQNKVILVQYGLDGKLFSTFHRKESEKIRFGYIGTLLPAKGVHIPIKAFNRIRNRNVELKIYGNPLPYKGFEYYPGYVKKLVKNGNIQFMGGFDHKNISGIFSEIDVLIFPSIWNENCPLTILEAFLTKTPVIASRIGGIPELIKDKENGLLFEPNNLYDLCDKIKIFINHPDLIEKFKISIESPKSIEDNAREIEGLYDYLLTRRNN